MAFAVASALARGGAGDCRPCNRYARRIFDLLRAQGYAGGVPRSIASLVVNTGRERKLSYCSRLDACAKIPGCREGFMIGPHSTAPRLTRRRNILAAATHAAQRPTHVSHRISARGGHSWCRVCGSGCIFPGGACGLAYRSTRTPRRRRRLAQFVRRFPIHWSSIQCPIR